MPFEDSKKEDPKIKLNNVSSQPSIFANQPKKPTKQDLEEKVKHIISKQEENKSKARDLAIQYSRILKDKKLVENKTVFDKDIEKQILSDMMRLAEEINNDENEKYGMGSLGWISLILHALIAQNNKINDLAYKNEELTNYINNNLSEHILKGFISKEIANTLEKLEKSKL